MPHLQNTVPHSTPHVHDLHRTTTGCLFGVATASHSIRCSAVTLFLSFCCVLVDEHRHIVTVAMRPLRLNVSHGSQGSLPRPCVLLLPFSSSAKQRHGHCCETLKGEICLWIRTSLHSLSQIPTMCLTCCHHHRLLHVFDCQSSCGHREGLTRNSRTLRAVSGWCSLVISAGYSLFPINFHDSF